MLRRTFPALVATLLLAFSLSGCFKAEQDITISSDEKVSGTMVLAMKKEAIETMASFGEEMGDADFDSRAAWDQLQEEDAESEVLPPGGVKEPYAEGDFIGDKYTFSDVPLADFVTFMNDDSEDPEGSADEFNLKHVDDTYVFDSSVDMTDFTGGDEEGSDELLGDAEMEQFLELYGVPTYRISLTFPGEVTKHNGKLDGTTVTWDLDMTSKDVTSLNAVAKDSGKSSGAKKGSSDSKGSASDNDEDGDSFPVVPVAIAGGVVLLILIGLIALLMVRRKRSV